MKIYKAEQEIADLFKSNNKITWACELKSDKELVNSDQIVNFAKANHIDSADLYPFTAILVSTLWNGNDDVFTKEETWLARNTPRNHPQNVGHVDTEIVGHITSVGAFDFEGVPVSNELYIDDLPNFDLVVNGVVYTQWQSAEKLDQVLSLIDKIESGEMFISMECIFRGFDYALRTSAGESRIVKRTAETAYLTKNLRSFGGTGLYEGQRIGRVPKDIIFTGSGFVENPANSRSKIFSNYVENSSPDKYLEIAEASNSVKANMENKMNEDTEKLTAELDTLKAEMETLKANLESANKDLEKAKADLETANDLNAQLQADKQALIDEKAGAASNVEASAEKLMAAEKEKSELVEKIEALNVELETAKAEHKLSNRKYNLMISKNLKEDEALAKTKLFANLTDEQWNEVINSFNPKQSVDAEALAEAAKANQAQAGLSLEGSDAAEKEAEKMKILSDEVREMIRGKK